MLNDEKVIEVFESSAAPPKWIEAIDVENNEYSFCDDRGQRFVGIVTKSRGWFGDKTFELRPEGAADISNALSLVEKAVAVKPNERFSDLSALCEYLNFRLSKQVADNR
jgi:hypothetical protein